MTFAVDRCQNTKYSSALSGCAWFYLYDLATDRFLFVHSWTQSLFWEGAVVRYLATILGSSPFFPRLLICILWVIMDSPSAIANCMARFRFLSLDGLGVTIFMELIPEATCWSGVVSSLGRAELPLPRGAS